MKHRTFSGLIYAAALLLCPLAGEAVMKAEFKLPASARAGVYIEDIITGEVITDINGELPLIPASITKAVTTASVLAEYNPDYRFTTSVYIQGKQKNGTVDGDIVIKVCGDPALESSHFPETAGFTDSIATYLTRRGINAVTGTVVIDATAFVDQPLPAGWVEEDFAWPYGAGHYSTNFRDNKFILSMPGRKSTPHVPGLVVRHTPAKGSLKIERKRDSKQFISRGTVRRGKQEVVLSNPSPDETLRHETIEKIKDAGIAIGNKQAGKDKDRSLLYEHSSPELRDILRSLMVRSDNMMAEGALRMIAPGDSRQKAVENELRIWNLRDIDTQGVNLEDGSGLSRNDRLTPYFMGDMLVWMASHHNATDYVNLFPKAGLEGTMKNFLCDTPLEGTIAMKTGSMRDVRCYAGYKLDNEGFPTHVIVVMVNKYACGGATVKKAVEDFLLSTFAPGFDRE
ncbi:MAG: D-alanyl-D-alanine carboxypeptidase/D-alanyl-D-alanine-endopeptidase [Muribaculaceae bacterium]|nr:D-alanyl-D-alanine carboxypeptidase/D-alanyl-D-alanine-endopeptidase [Muribaculaceae bacterium]